MCFKKCADEQESKGYVLQGLKSYSWNIVPQMSLVRDTEGTHSQNMTPQTVWEDYKQSI